MAIIFGDVYARILAVTNCRTQVELATILGIRQSSVSDAKKRGAVPAEWLLTILQRYGVNPDWLLTGLGSQFLRPAEVPSEGSVSGATHILRLCTACDATGGIWKRIDENRELLDCLRQYAPEFLERCVWAEERIATQDAFLNTLRLLLDLPETPRGEYRFPRPWTGKRFDAVSMESLRNHFLES